MRPERSDQANGVGGGLACEIQLSLGDEVDPLAHHDLVGSLRTALSREWRRGMDSRPARLRG